MISTALLLLLHSVAAAAPEVPSFPSFPSVEDIARAVGDQLGRMVNDFFQNNLLALLGRLLLALLGGLGFLLWSAISYLLGGVNFITQMPEAWVIELGPVQRMIDRLTTVALGAVGMLVVWTTFRLVLTMMSFQPWQRVLKYYPRQMLAAAVILLTEDIIRWFIRFANTVTGVVMDPFQGLTGLNPSFEAFTVVGVMFIVYALAVFRLAIRRAKVIVLAGVLIAVMPLAVVLWCTPLEVAEEAFDKWLVTLAGCILVQIPQAAALAIGATLIGAAFSTGDAGTRSPAEGAVALAMGIGSVLAAEHMPVGINRRIFRPANAGLKPGVVQTAAQVATVAAGVGYGPGMGYVAQQTAQTAVHTVRQTQQFHSILATAPLKALPPPKP